MKLIIKGWGQQEFGQNDNLLRGLLKQHIPVPNLCSGKGTCGKCKVRIIKGVPPAGALDYKHLSETEMRQGIRLACGVQAQEGMEIELESRDIYDRKNNAFLFELKEELNSGLRKLVLEIPQPSLQDERGDWDRIHDGLQRALQSEVDFIPTLPVLERVSGALRERNFQVTATLWKDRVLDLQEGDTSKELYGIAVDIGTTSVAAALVDLTSGRVSGVRSAENEQTNFGGDVISRIAYANEGKEMLTQLKIASLNTVNTLIDELLHEYQLSANSLYKMTVVANTTMSHLFLGLPVDHLAVAPFVSVYNRFQEFSAAELGLNMHPDAIVQIFPNIGSFVGGDTVGAVLGTPAVLAKGNHLLIDLGTNCELFLKTDTRMFACSTAAGPAFEGAGIAQGMRAKPGAIEGIRISENALEAQSTVEIHNTVEVQKTVEIRVIGEVPAKGICGSGLIEGIEQMRKAGILSRKGTIANPENDNHLGPELKARIRQGAQVREFVLAYGSAGSEDVCLNQKDIEALQLAKGAVCAGIRTLTEIAGISLKDLDTVYLAGTFATYLSKESIVQIGLIPETDQAKIIIAGNSAHTGAVRALINTKELGRAVGLARQIQHVELGGNKIFKGYFMKSMALEPMV